MRKRSNTGLEEISRATGITQAVLKALEAEDREQLPPEVYTRAFYKKYAGYLGLDPDEVLASYGKQPKKDARPKNSSVLNTVATLKGREEARFGGMVQKLFLLIAISFGGALLYWIYKYYLASYYPFGLF